MSRVFPGAENKLPPLPPSPSPTTTRSISDPSSFTVLKKSSISFDCMDGFTVFDSSGRLVFRVDNYQRSCPCLTREVVLIDGKGTPLFTLRRRRKILSMHERWDVFKGETDSMGIQTRQLFSIKKRDVVWDNGQAVVFFIGENFLVPAFYIEGDYNKRSCKILLAVTREVAAEICRKQVNPAILLGSDVFSLIVRPGFDNEMMMAFIIVMDRISRKPLLIPALCC